LYDPGYPAIVVDPAAIRLYSEYKTQMTALLLDGVSNHTGRKHTLQTATDPLQLLARILELIHSTAAPYAHRTEFSWFDRGWMSQYATLQEDFLALRPMMNRFVAQYALYYLGLSVVEFLSLNSDVAYEDLNEMVPKSMLVSRHSEREISRSRSRSSC
jgi:hypothetical protein